MHPASYEFMKYFVEKYLDKQKKTSIIDIGSMNINGIYRPIFENNDNWEYVGMDIQSGPNVDIVGFENIKDKYDVLISGQVMEHVKRPWEWLPSLKKYIKQNGLICIIVPHTLDEHKYPIDTYRYFPDGMIDLFEFSNINILEIKKNYADTMGIGKIVEVNKIKNNIKNNKIIYRYQGMETI